MEKKLNLPFIISDGMVLQREDTITIWGYATPMEEVTVEFLEHSYEIKVDTQGRWELELCDLKAGGPYEMKIMTKAEQKIVKDILIGDVWLLGGQSNMEMPIADTLDLFEEEVKDAECAYIRQFKVPLEYDFHGPREELHDGEWKSVTPETIYEFSAPGYFFSKEIYEKHQVPIGLIQAAIGGTPAESWLSEQTLKQFPRFQEEIERCKDDAFVEETKRIEEEQTNQWYQNLNQKDQGYHDPQGPWYRSDYDDSDWKSMSLPNRFTGTDLEEIKGSVWFRKEVIIPESMANKKAKLVLGTIVDGDDTYLNGVQVGTTGFLYPTRRYDLPEGLLKEGKNILTVRVRITKNIGAFVTDMPYYIQTIDQKIPIDGEWNYRIGAITEQEGDLTFFQWKPTGVYNAMIYPLRKYTIKGALWYQGESNAGYPEDYKELFEAIIKEWRTIWNKEFPFFYVQLANYCPWRLEPEESGWAQIREKQRQAFETDGTGMAVIIDVGDYNDLHPQDKKSVGHRLALWARNRVYGEDIVCSGPLYDRIEVKGQEAILHFTHIGGGLEVKGDRLKMFLVSEEDGVYYPGEARIEGDTVIVSSANVKNPVYVRYAWAESPDEANLYNKEGLPASPFQAVADYTIK